MMPSDVADRAREGAACAGRAEHCRASDAPQGVECDAGGEGEGGGGAEEEHCGDGGGTGRHHAGAEGGYVWVIQCVAHAEEEQGNDRTGEGGDANSAGAVREANRGGAEGEG